MACSEIVSTVISTNRYAPAGSDSVKLWNYNGAADLTLAQLVSAVCIRRAAQLEKQAVGVMNQMTQAADTMDELSGYVVTMMDTAIGTEVADWTNIRKRLIALGCAEGGLPASVASYKDRLQAYETIETRLKALNSVSDQAGIELQTCASRRDVTYSLSSSVTYHMGNSAIMAASVLKGK